ncbi:hypothetical protein BJ322DRAFT_582066 [Thelephora terrestris]|uniref:Secreted protein n=1 Tax=Thelephora terrestris TaxID=56493 RepID=A0A9P6HK32_9AGAM|nr:hypothetical protein BJ322DRAFT_582066 [Thelephora terrestris]
MFRLLVLCFTALSLICAIECTPTAEKWGKPSYGAKRENLVARGRCDFLCPHENLMGMGLDDMYTGSERLYCSYDAEGMDDNNFCIYNRDTGGLLSSSLPEDCNQLATFRCPGTKNDQEGMKWSPSQPKDSRSVNLPQFVKARSKAKRAEAA